MFKKMCNTVLVILSFLSSLVLAEYNFPFLQAQAKLSDDTYLAPKDLEAVLQAQGESLIHQSTIVGSQVSYFLSEAGGVQTIGVRGTANLENVILDLSVSLLLDTTLNIKLHRGFASGARAIYEDIRPYLSKKHSIRLTGHSLGGAIAVILAMYLSEEGYSIGQVVTFGQPKVTNVTGAKAYADLPLIRVVTPKDIIPLVPPISPLQIKDLDIYWHIGVALILMGEGEYSQTQGIKSTLRAAKFFNTAPNEENLEAHKMATYINLIDKLSLHAVQVPYSMGINIFGISVD